MRSTTNSFGPPINICQGNTIFSPPKKESRLATHAGDPLSMSHACIACAWRVLAPNREEWSKCRDCYPPLLSVHDIQLLLLYSWQVHPTSQTGGQSSTSSTSAAVYTTWSRPAMGLWLGLDFKVKNTSYNLFVGTGSGLNTGQHRTITAAEANGQIICQKAPIF